MKSLMKYFLLLLFLAGCSKGREVKGAGEAQNVIEVTDIAGREVKVKLPVKRIVLSEGRQTYILAALEDKKNPFARVVGWGNDLKKADHDGYEKYLAAFPEIADITVIGSPYKGEQSAEKVIDLDPDVVFLNIGSYDSGKEFVDVLAKAGIPTVVVDYRQRPMLNTIPSTLIFGEILQKEKRAQEIVDFYLKETRRVYDGLKDLKERKTVFLGRAAGISNDLRLRTVARANLGQLIEQAGGDNIALKSIPGDYGDLNPEELIVQNPDIILVTGANWVNYNKDNRAVPFGYSATEEKIKEKLENLVSLYKWDKLKAGENKNIYGLWHQFYNSPYNFVALQAFAKWFYPERFKDLSPTETFKKFHEKFLPVEYSGVFFFPEGGAE